MKGYLIAFAGKPNPGFLDQLKQMSANDGVPIEGAILTDGPGCRNLAVLVADDTPERWVETLTMALMPAKYENCSDPRLVAGQFLVDLS